MKENLCRPGVVQDMEALSQQKPSEQHLVATRDTIEGNPPSAVFHEKLESPASSVAKKLPKLARCVATISIAGTLLFPSQMSSSAEESSGLDFNQIDISALTHTPDTQLPVDSFQDTFEKTINPERIWGDQLTGNIREAYKFDTGDSIYTVRPVRYYSKGRMDVNPNEKEYHEWFVKTGLLVKEMIDGVIQVGDSTFVEHTVSDINIVGDPHPDNITYASIAHANNTDSAPLEEGAIITKTVDIDGVVSSDARFAQYDVTATHYVPETGHTIATPIWETIQKDGALQQKDPFYFTGLPISEPYWTTAYVGGEKRDVLVQAFERRTMTYTPDNILTTPDYAVEAGNAGIHYLQWRYSQKESEQGQPVDTLDYLVPDNSAQSLNGSHNLSTYYDQEKNKLYLTKASADSYELYEITDDAVYLREDHSNGGDEYYTFSEGLMLKRNMKVGETLSSPENTVNFYKDGELSQSMPFPIKTTLLACKEVYIGGDLGMQDVMVYKYDWRSHFEVFYFSKEYGWVMWELYNQEELLQHNAIFNRITPDVMLPSDN